MRLLSLFPFIITILISTACSSFYPPRIAEMNPLDVPVESYTIMSVEDLNQALTSLSIDDPQPFQLVLSILNISHEQQTLIIEQQYPNSEDKNRIIVTIFREGYLDDSVRGEWNKVNMQRINDKDWRVTSAKHALRCWRATNKNFQNKPCP